MPDFVPQCLDSGVVGAAIKPYIQKRSDLWSLRRNCSPFHSVRSFLPSIIRSPARCDIPVECPSEVLSVCRQPMISSSSSSPFFTAPSMFHLQLERKELLKKRCSLESIGDKLPAYCDRLQVHPSGQFKNCLPGVTKRKPRNSRPADRPFPTIDWFLSDY